MNEPVAWIWSEDGCNLGVCLDQDKQMGKQEFQDYDIPLYTHPVKELTDEEILQVMMNVYSDTVPPIRGIEFAKAILKKGGCDGNICQQYSTHPVKEQELLDEIAHLKHLNRNWQISENILLLELEKLQMRELTDEEISQLWSESHEDGIAMQQGFTTQQHYFASLILRKAQE